jgi:hypothetical protein
MRIGRADEVAEHHARQLEIVDIVALALREADVFDALALAAQALEGGLARSAFGVMSFILQPPWRPFSFSRGGWNGLDDVLVTGAAAQIAGHTQTDFLFGRVRVLLQQRWRA